MLPGPAARAPGRRDYLLCAYFHDDRGVYVNLYVPSEVTWKGVRLVQDTTYPEDETTRITVRGTGEFSIHLRVPAWASGATLLVNGVPRGEKPLAGQFAEVRRAWRDGDVLQATFPLEQRQEPIDDRHPQLVTVLRGPVMMVATVDPVLRLGEEMPGHARPIPAAAPVPFYRVRDEIYTTYLSRDEESVLLACQGDFEGEVKTKIKRLLRNRGVVTDPQRAERIRAHFEAMHPRRRGAGRKAAPAPAEAKPQP